jgi:hypothetical protein
MDAESAGVATMAHRPDHLRRLMTAVALLAPAAAGETGFGWNHLGAPWHAAIVLALALAVAVWGWRRYGPAPAGAFGHIARLCRSTALALVVLLIAGPSWYRSESTWLPGRLLVAVDRSASMERSDADGGRTRSAAAADLAKRLSRLDPTRVAVEVHAIGGVADRLDAAGLDAAAQGPDSPLGADLDRLVAERRPDLLVLATDGRVTGGPDLAAVAPRLTADGDLGVLVLALGGERIDPELFIDDVQVNREIPLGEVEPVSVRLSVRGAPGKPIAVRLALDGLPMADATVTAPAAGDPAALLGVDAQLAATIDRPGQHTLTVTADMGGRTVVQQIPVTARERKMTVLLLDRTPRYEVRYLREALRRDTGVTTHAYLAEGGWRRWGDAGPDGFVPLSEADLVRYDVVVIGDLGAESINDVQMNAIANAVRKGGTGLVWLPGETGAVASLARTPGEALFPAALPESAAILRAYRDQRPRRLERTAVAERLGLLDAGENVQWNVLDPLLGALPVSGLKPAAEALAIDQDGNPLVVDRPFGAGRTLLLAADDTWRWRRGVGDAFLHRYWSQLLRHAAGGRHGGDAEWRVFASPRRATSGEPVVVHLVRRNADITPPAEPPAIRLVGPGQPPAEILVKAVADGDGFAARLLAPAAGGWRLEIAGGIDSRRVDQGSLLVLPPQAELRDPRADRAGLAAFAKATGGQVFTDAEALLKALPADPRHERRTTSVLGLWDTWLALLAVVTLLAIDWSIRRANRLP